MDLFDAIRNRRSCRSFNAEPIPRESIEKLLQAAAWAPSPLNTQPWQFIVITDQGKKEAIFSEAERCRKWAIDVSGWKWLKDYSLNFLKKAPVIIAVVGDPSKSGVDQFQEEGRVGYQLACAAAIQNMLLAAHALDLGSLWFTFYEKSRMRTILELPEGKTPVSLVCIGKPRPDLPPVPRKDVREKTIYV
jgi:nitroreductase